MTCYDRVLPFYEALGIEIGAVLTDNGREFCGKPTSHPFELLLAMEGNRASNDKGSLATHQTGSSSA